jgi:hypothetical protein
MNGQENQPDVAFVAFDSSDLKRPFCPIEQRTTSTANDDLSLVGSHGVGVNTETILHRSGKDEEVSVLDNKKNSRNDDVADDVKLEAKESSGVDTINDADNYADNDTNNDDYYDADDERPSHGADDQDDQDDQDATTSWFPPSQSSNPISPPAAPHQHNSNSQQHHLSLLNETPYLSSSGSEVTPSTSTNTTSSFAAAVATHSDLRAWFDMYSDSDMDGEDEDDWFSDDDDADELVLAEVITIVEQQLDNMETWEYDELMGMDTDQGFSTETGESDSGSDVDSLWDEVEDCDEGWEGVGVVGKCESVYVYGVRISLAVGLLDPRFWNALP